MTKYGVSMLFTYEYVMDQWYTQDQGGEFKVESVNNQIGNMDSMFAFDTDD